MSGSAEGLLTRAGAWLDRRLGLAVEEVKKSMSAVTHARPSFTYADDQGWFVQGLVVGKGSVYAGKYRARGIAWEGRAMENNGNWQFWIHKPPMVFIEGSRWRGCFHPEVNGWWLVNVHDIEGRYATDLDSGIAAINHVLASTFRPGQRRAR